MTVGVSAIEGSHKVPDGSLSDALADRCLGVHSKDSIQITSGQAM